MRAWVPEPHRRVAPALASRRPSGENATEFTPSLWPSSTPIGWALSTCIWDAVSGRLLAVFGQSRRFRGPSDAFFLPGGRSIAVVNPHFDRDADLEIYDCVICGPVDALADLAVERVTRGLSNAERERYLHETS